VSANPYFVRRARLLGLNVDNEQRGEEGATQNSFCLLVREGARHPTHKEFFLQVVLDFAHIRVSGGIVGQNNRFNQRRHVSQRKTMPQVFRKERIGRGKAVLGKEKIEGV